MLWLSSLRVGPVSQLLDVPVLCRLSNCDQLKLGALPGLLRPGMGGYRGGISPRERTDFN